MLLKQSGKNFPTNFAYGGKKRGDDQRIIANKKREQSIGILQKRYGYNKEKATSKLDEHYPKAELC